MPLPDTIAAWRDTAVGMDSDFMVGPVNALWAQRYAIAVDDLDPMYFDEGYARSHGLRGLVAPLNYLTTQRHESAAGPAESSMQSDGLPQGSGPPLAGLAVMGGGQDIVFHEHVYCGEIIVGKKRVVRVEERTGRSGAMVVVEEEIRYFNSQGEAKVTLLNTVLYRVLSLDGIVSTEAGDGH